jgi:hypothetical protein
MSSTGGEVEARSPASLCPSFPLSRFFTGGICSYGLHFPGINKLKRKVKVMNRREILLHAGGVLSVLLLFLLTGCGARDGFYSEGLMENKAPMPASRSGAAVMDFAEEVSASEPSRQEDIPASERKMISTGSMELEVDDLDAAERSIREALKAFAGGYVQSANRYGDSFSMTLKIPAEGFSDFLEKAEDFGKIRSASTNVEDVTERYFDLEHRIRSKEILVERYQNYLLSAESIEDILKVERELNSTITELEQLQGSFQNLSHQISLSTLHLQVYLPSWEAQSDPLPSLRAGLKAFGRTVLRVLYALFFLVLGIVTFGVPAVLILGVLYWIGFGRIGLVRRFFKKLRPAGSSEEVN